MAVPSSVVGNHPGPTCLRTRGGGCAISKEPAADAPKLIATKPTVLQPQDSELIKLPSGGFACYASPLFKEYLGLLGDGVGAPAGIGEITPTDALLIIDMQRDFVPKSSTNTDGGRFGVAEGDHLIPLCEQLIDYFCKCGGLIVATRDYHPFDHVSFASQDGPFPAHCVQGTPGSLFLPRIAAALAAAKSKGGNVEVAFKGFHEDIDSFGALAYQDGGEGRIQKRPDIPAEACMACCMGCAKAPWTGSLIMKQSAIMAAAEKDSDHPLDMDAPPDVLSVLADGKERNLKSLPDALKPCKRLFVCGLALDFCVLDTCLNAASPNSGLSDSQVFMVLDAARAAHIPGFGTFGSGFLSEPAQVLQKMQDANVQRTSVESITGESPYGFMQSKPAFPRSLGQLSLATAKGVELRLEASTYKVLKGLSSHMAELDRLSKAVEGRLSPRAKMPLDWPGAPTGAVSVCWAYPLEGIASLQKRFLSVTTSPALMFAAYGGFLLLDATDHVLAVQAIAPEGGEASVAFGEQHSWRDEFTQQLKETTRFQPITLPYMLEAGAREFCWINPGERLVLDRETWCPSLDGAFLYLMASGESFYFPAELRTTHSAMSKPRAGSVRI